MQRGVCVMLAVLCSGCVTTETVRFQPKSQQEAITRDGNPGIVSRKRSSIVIVRPASRQFGIGQRPVYVVGISNTSSRPLQFRVSDVQVTQVSGSNALPLKVITYEELVTEERNRQIFAAVVTGLAAGANAVAASQQGYYNRTSTIYTSSGSYQVHTSGYSPTAAAIAQSRAAAQNEAMIAATIERGQQNMAMLESSVIKDNTLLPGEWYGGQLHLQPPSSETEAPKTYIISVLVGDEQHDIEVLQGTPDALSKVRTAEPSTDVLLASQLPEKSQTAQQEVVTPVRRSDQTHKRAADRQGAADAAIVAAIIRESRNGYYSSGKTCACPEDRTASGRRCGGNSAYSRPGWAQPLCHPGDVTAAMIANYRQRSAQAETR